jgi:DNA polymerase III delta prime subunit
MHNLHCGEVLSAVQFSFLTHILLLFSSNLFTLLLAVIEKYTRSTRFALICNHVNKIIPALQSRCTRFRFAPLDGSHVTERLQHIIKSEG